MTGWNLAARALGPALALAYLALLEIAPMTDTAHADGEALPDLATLWDFGDPKASEARFRALLPRLRERRDVDGLAQTLTQVARAEGLQLRFEDAHRTLDEVEALIADRDLAVARARYLLERGRAFDSAVHPKDQKRTAEARACYVAAFEHGRARGLDRFALDAAHMLGIIEPPEAGLAWAERAIALAEASTDDKARGWLGPLYNNTGWTLHDLGRYEEALAMFERGLRFREARGEPGPTRIARWSVGRALRSLGRVDEALALQRALLAEYEAAGEEEAGYGAEEVGECLWALGRRDEARPYFARASARLRVAEPWLVDAEPARLERLARLAAGGE